MPVKAVNPAIPLTPIISRRVKVGFDSILALNGSAALLIYSVGFFAIYSNLPDQEGICRPCYPI
jgi:hypothetical protein